MNGVGFLDDYPRSRSRLLLLLLRCGQLDMFPSATDEFFIAVYSAPPITHLREISSSSLRGAAFSPSSALLSLVAFALSSERPSKVPLEYPPPYPAW